MAGRGGGFLQNLKGKITETFKDLSAGTTPDPYERKLEEHVERATSELLTGPDWGLNFELVDTINNDPQGSCDKVFRAIRKSLLKPNIHKQLLALTLLEVCVKNCVPFFFQQLIYSDLWQEIVRAGDPLRNWDPEVRDRALGLIEDFAKGLPLQAYREACDSLLDRGVDFPVRPQAADAGAAPYYTPPPMPAAAAAAAQGISPEDRAAIAAAVADLEAQAAEQAAHDAALAPPGLPAAGHVPALMGPAVLMGAPIRPPGYHPPAGYHPPHAAASQPPMVAGAAPIGPTGVPQPGGGLITPSPIPGGTGAGTHLGAGGTGTPLGGGTGPGSVPSGREEVEQSLRVSRNSAELLVEMLAPIKSGGDAGGLQETFVADLVDQCYRYKSVLAELIPRLTEVDLISGALAANDDLARALLDYEELAKGTTAGAGAAAGVAAAGAEAGAAAGSSAGGATPGSSTGGMGQPVGPSTFTLLDEDDEGEELSLQSSRAGQSAAGAPPKADDLISFDAPAPSATPGEQQLVGQMDQLLLSGQQPPKPE